MGLFIQFYPQFGEFGWAGPDSTRESASPKRQTQSTSNGAEALKSQRNREEHWRKYLCREIGRRNIVRWSKESRKKS